MSQYEINVTTAPVRGDSTPEGKNLGSYQKGNIVEADNDKVVNGFRYINRCITPTSPARDVAGWVLGIQMDAVGVVTPPDNGGGDPPPLPPPSTDQSFTFKSNVGGKETLVNIDVVGGIVYTVVNGIART